MRGDMAIKHLIAKRKSPRNGEGFFLKQQTAA
ncbi:hypothetical protein LMG3431_03792 [Achromobacter pestifer]|uniref:Uncharacterized protein n=1 Tax=Achromobacter pestifer TaxID=1353889 RepID=A0A6S6Z9U8_9BURK|nr:hypothetical protein LMG3431_03792 [Achromobacter pestifer]